MSLRGGFLVKKYLRCYLGALVIILASDLPASTPDAPWLLKPYFPREGIVLLYGKKGVGKSPLTWALAESYATGAPWLGMAPQNLGTTLYIEADTPRLVVSPRMREVMKSPNIAICFPDGSLAVEQGWKRLQAETAGLAPGLVVINTLRKVHLGDDKTSQTPTMVYTRFKHQWPRACLVFVHHEKKTPSNPDHELGSGEEFSGSLAWANDAQVVLRLWCHAGARVGVQGRETILTMTGNQAAPTAPPLRYFLVNGAKIDIPAISSS